MVAYHSHCPLWWLSCCRLSRMLDGDWGKICVFVSLPVKKNNGKKGSHHDLTFLFVCGEPAKQKAEDSQARPDQNALQINIHETDCIYKCSTTFSRLTKQKQCISNMHRSSFVELLLGNEGCTMYYTYPTYWTEVYCHWIFSITAQHFSFLLSKFPLSYHYNQHNET